MNTLANIIIELTKLKGFDCNYIDITQTMGNDYYTAISVEMESVIGGCIYLDISFIKPNSTIIIEMSYSHLVKSELNLNKPIVYHLETNENAFTLSKIISLLHDLSFELTQIKNYVNSKNNQLGFITESRLLIKKIFNLTNDYMVSQLLKYKLECAIRGI